MLPWMYTTGRSSRRACAGVVTSGREATTYGTLRPSVVVATSPTQIGAPSFWSESMNASTSA
jgi:hypothetical protein